MLTPDNKAANFTSSQVGPAYDANKKVDQRQTPPRTDKSFEEVLREKEKGKDSKKLADKDRAPEGEEELIEEQDKALSKGAVKRKASIFDLNPNKKKLMNAQDNLAEGLLSNQPIENLKVPFEKENISSRIELSTEQQPDLSKVNALYTPKVDVGQNAIASTEKPIAPQISSTIQELINKIVENIQTLQTNAKLDTTITLKHPLFQGAELTLTAFKSAQGEFNITFSNLTQQAQKIIDLNSDGLRMALENKGFVVHIITTTTQPEKINIAQADQQPFNRGDDRGGQQEQQNQRERKRDNLSGGEAEEIG